MNKKDVSVIFGVGTLLMGAYCAYTLSKQKESQDKLSKKVNRLAKCHNNFVRFQGAYNDITSDEVDNINDRVDYLEDENISNYNHILEVEESLNDDLTKDSKNEDCDNLEDRVD